MKLTVSLWRRKRLGRGFLLLRIVYAEGPLVCGRGSLKAQYLVCQLLELIKGKLKGIRWRHSQGVGRGKRGCAMQVREGGEG